MKKYFLFLALWAACCQGNAAVPPPEKLLPKETTLVMTVPEAAKSWASFTNSFYGHFWDDPAMKPFRDNFMTNLQTQFVGPLERQFGIKLADYKTLLQGQVTLALVQDYSKPTPVFSPVLLVDSGDQSPKLKAALADLKKKWADAGKPMKTEQIRGIEFTTYTTSRSELSNSWTKAFPVTVSGAATDASAPSGSDKKIQFVVGQSDSLLLVSDSAKTIEKILTRQTGGLIPGLDENPAFQADFGARLRGAPLYVWVDFKALFAQYLVAPQSQKSAVANVIGAMGLADLKTLAMVMRDNPEGLSTQLFVGVPEANRRGIFKLMAIEPQDANPPPFVPADAVKFMRWRVDLPRTWTTVEKLFEEISPAAKGAMSLVLESAGKDKDPNYDFKTELLSSLGNDVIMYQKAARGTSLNELASPPIIVLIGSPKPERLASAIKVAGELLSQGATIKESDFLGRKLYKLIPPGKEAASLNFGATGSYLAFSTDIAMLEEYLRSSESKPKSLSEMPGLNQAAEKIGGMRTGLFGFSNDKEDMRATFEMLRKSSSKLGPIASNATLTDRGEAESIKALSQWADFSLLPPFDSVSKYFNYSVYSAAYSADGLTMTFFSPTPPPQPVKESTKQ